MLTSKRVIIATLCGVIFGLVCMYLASSNPDAPISTTLKWTIVMGRTMMGFMIGISALKLSWWLHGIVIGAVSSIPMAIPILPDINIMIATIVMGIIYGFLTELITAVAFKEKPVALRA